MFIPCYADRWNLPHIYQPTYHTGDTPVNTVYSVSAAADVLSVSVSTIRRICADMADILPDYQPAPGQTRTLSTADVLTISAILTRLQARPGLTRSALLAELSAPGSEPLIIPASLPTKAPSTAQESPGRAIPSQPIQTDVIPSQTALQALADVRSDMRQMIAPLSTLPATLDSLQARIDALESRPQSQTAPASPPRAPERLPLVLSGVAAGVLIFALVGVAIWQNIAAAVLCIAIALIAVLLGIVAPLRK